VVIKDDYDKYCMKSCNTNEILISTRPVYFDDDYAVKLKDILAEKGLTKKFIKELNLGKNVKKMCSAASSARLCFWHFFDNKNIIYEETEITNCLCYPNYDAHDEKNNIFYECKCHEIFDSPSAKFSYNYICIFNKYFKMRYEKKTKNHKDGVVEKYIEPTYNDFGIEDFGQNASIYRQKFDFKQMLCHIFGLLTLDTNPTLKYIIFVPNEEIITKNETRENRGKVGKWLKNTKTLIDIIFTKIGEVKVYKDEKEHKLGDLINFEYEFIDVSKVEDKILKEYLSKN